jgi:hypothetical protein
MFKRKFLIAIDLVYTVLVGLEESGVVDVLPLGGVAEIAVKGVLFVGISSLNFFYVLTNRSKPKKRDSSDNVSEDGE